jgi:hypothetical protein
MRAPLVFALTLLALPAAAQALRPASDRVTAPSPGPGYSGFTSAPIPSLVPTERDPAYRAGSPGDSGGPLHSTPFAGIPYSTFPQNGGQISPAMRDTSSAWNVIPDMSK